MSRSVSALIGLVAVDVATLSGTVAGYVLTVTEAGGEVIHTPVPVDGTTATLTLNPGVWTPSVVVVDASGALLTAPITGDALNVVDLVVVTVSVPASVALALA